MSKKKRKHKPKEKDKMGFLSQLKTNVALRLTFIGLLVTFIGLLVSIGFNVYFYDIQLPQLRELQKIKEDFPMVNYIYEATEIAKPIPWPEPLEPTEYFDYFPTVVINTAQAPSSDFQTMPYGYALRLVTGNNTYLATDSPEESAEKRVVFTIGELREKRNKLTWFLYEGPFPPEGWSEFK